MSDPSPLGTRREVADQEIRRYQRALDRIRFGGKGNEAVIRQKLDDWLDYRLRAQQDGTLDEEVRL